MSIAYLSRRCALRSQIPLDRFVSFCCSKPWWFFLFSCFLSVSSLEKNLAQDPPPVARWDFGAEETTSYRTVGEVQRDQPGPRPPRFPDLDPGNTAIRLEGRGARLEIADPGSHSPYDFAQGDSITLEAWVRITDLGDHEYHTVIGKGRTWQPGMPRDNHNWSMRIRRIDGKGHLDFLFATDPTQSDPAGPWHRWTSDAILSMDPQWHHVAIAYQFGHPESIRGWVDGNPVQGAWTMGGPTTLPPVVDDDAVWIGSSMNGSAGNSFIGLLDAIAIHRRLLTDPEIDDRYHVDDKIPSAVVRMPQIDVVPEGKIALQLIEAVGSHSRWPDAEEPLATPTLTTDRLPAFFLPRLPARFDAWGIRDAWKAPLLARLAADVELPAGPSTFLLRARGLSRLWVDGQLVAQCGPLTGSPSGEEPITPLPKAIAPGVRMPSYRQQEATGQVERPEAGKVRVVLETMVGGKSFRPEPGELLVALQTAGSDAFQLLTPTGIPILLTDAGIEPLLAKEQAAWNLWDDDQRHTLSASQDPYWQQRHQAARQWLASRPSPIDPDQGDSQEIDRMIQRRIDALAVQQQESR
ncbi:MAG: LamG domain-containing protein [Pirellulaceae bacterium]